VSIYWQKSSFATWKVQSLQLRAIKPATLAIESNRKQALAQHETTQLGDLTLGNFNISRSVTHTHTQPDQVHSSQNALAGKASIRASLVRTAIADCAQHTQSVFWQLVQAVSLTFTMLEAALDDHH
jgi:hypothetical protein